MDARVMQAIMSFNRLTCRSQILMTVVLSMASTAFASLYDSPEYTTPIYDDRSASGDVTAAKTEIEDGSTAPDSSVIVVTDTGDIGATDENLEERSSRERSGESDRSRRSYFERITDGRCHDSSEILRSVVVASAVECAAVCVENPEPCTAMEFRREDGQCRLLSGVQETDLVPETGCDVFATVV